MIGFAMVLVLILWMVFGSQKSQSSKKIKKSDKKIPLKVKTQAHSEEPGKYLTRSFKR
jgi:hypothetical protein